MKRFALILALLLLMLSQTAFAADSADLQSKITIVSPALGTESDVILSNDLYLSIRIDEPVDCLIKVVKVEEYAIDMTILDKVFMNIELTEEEKGRIYNANIARNYFRLGDELEAMKEDLANQETFEEEDMEEQAAWEQAYQSMLQQYLFYEEAYRKIFYTEVMAPEPLTYEGILPFFERTIPIAESGDYKMVFEDVDGLVLLEIDFQIKSKDSVAEEIIRSIPLRLIRMIDFFN